MEIIVAIDGPAGSGKSTIAKLISKELGYIYIDTGAMYRMIALNFLNKNIDLNNNESVENAMKKIKIDMKNDKFYLNDEDVSEKIRTREVSNNVSKVAAISVVRRSMVSLQRETALGKKAILDGRDIGTVVFPKADVKIYLDAGADIRAKRRLNEFLEKGENVSYQLILEEIIKRDKEDMERKDSPLTKASDAIIVNTDNKTIEEVKYEIINIIEKKIIDKIVKN